MLNAMSAESVIQRDPEIMGGTPTFAGTRVQIRSLLDELASGTSMEEFMELYPDVSRQQIKAALLELCPQ